MKHLKTYKLFESVGVDLTDILLEINDETYWKAECWPESQTGKWVVIIKTVDEDEEYESEYERLNDEITTIQEEIQEIEDDPDGEYDTDKLDDIVNSRVKEYRDDMESFLSDYYGMPMGEFIRNNDMIDEKSFIQDVVDTDGYGPTLNTWDGSEESVSYNGDTYYLFDNGELHI